MSDLEQLLEFLRQGIDVKAEIRFELAKRRTARANEHNPPMKPK